MDIKHIIETELLCVQSDCDRDCAKCDLVMDTNEIVAAYKQVIEILGHESDDCIDRQDMLDAIGHGATYTSEEIQEIVKRLPRVVHLEKIGEWIFVSDCSNAGYYCSKCNKRIVREGWSKTVKRVKYCPNCGSFNGGEL